MLTLENISFGVKDEKGRERDYKNLTCPLEKTNLCHHRDRTAVESPHWRN